MDESFKQKQLHLRMVECNDTTGIVLADVLRCELDKQDLTSKVVACVKDGGSNLKVCTRALTDIVTCDSLGMFSCFQGSCFAHILSGACNAALLPSTSDGFTRIAFGKVKSALQRCITWTKKKERLMPTPFKTRFVSTVVMLTMMLRYRQVVQHCFSNQSSPELRTRVPSSDTWEIADVVADTLDPKLEATIRFQKKQGFLISDAVAHFGKLYLQYKNMYYELTLSAAGAISPTSSLEDQFKAYQRNIAYCIMDCLEPIIRPLREFSDMHSDLSHHYLSLVHDPVYKEMRTPFMTLHAENVNEERELAIRYDSELIIPLLLHLKRSTTSVENDQTPTAPLENLRNVPTTDGSNARNIQEIECFIIEEEIPEQRETNMLRDELNRFRQQPFNKESCGREEWLVLNRVNFPTVTLLAQHILAIPCTQIDNERVFSLAGRIASPLRSNISTENIDNLVSISRNHPDIGHNGSQKVASTNTLDEFCDYLLETESTVCLAETQEESLE